MDRMDSMIYENQHHASLAICRHFKKGHRHVILTAEMQSGKTGTFQTTIHCMLNDSTVDHVVVLCGMSDTNLYTQAITDTRKYNAHYFDEGRIHVFFLQHLKKTDVREILSILEKPNLLIVTDESDRDSTKGSVYHQIMTMARIPVNGDNTMLTERNIYMLNVSATPFAEYFDSEGGHSHKKQYVQLLPGVGYIGIREFYEAGQIKPILPITTQSDSPFLTYLRHKGNKYHIIRYDSKSKAYKFDLFKTIATRNDFGLFVYRSTFNHCPQQLPYKFEDMNALLNTSPDRPSIILIHGTFRAGFVFENKQHIGSVWETSTTIKTDTFVQALPGRVCGYNTSIDIDIFVSPHMFVKTGMSTARKMNEIERFIRFHSRHSREETETESESDASKQHIHDVSAFKHGKKKKYVYKHHATAVRRLPREFVEKHLSEISPSRVTIHTPALWLAIKDDLSSEQGRRSFLKNRHCITKKQYKELKKQQLTTLKNFASRSDIDGFSRSVTVRHAKGGRSSYDALIRSIQRSARLCHPVRNNQGVRSDSDVCDIVVFVVYPDFEGPQDEESRSTTHEFYYFFRTESVSNEDKSDTNGAEMFRHEFSEEEMETVKRTMEHVYTHGRGGHRVGHREVGFAEQRVEIIDSSTSQKVLGLFHDMICNYLSTSHSSNGVYHNAFRVTRSMKESGDMDEMVREIENEYNVKIDIQYDKGRYRSLDDTKLIKRLQIS